MQEVLVLDPDLSKDYLDRIQNRTKERRYSFDHAFGPNSNNWVCLAFFLCLVKVYVFILKSIAYCLTGKAMLKNELPPEIVLKPLWTSTSTGLKLE